MKKWIISALTIICILSLAAGCSEKNTSESKKEKIKEYPTKMINDIKMKINHIELNENGKGNRNLLNIKMDITNYSNVSIGIGGNDFILRDGNKVYKVLPSANNIGTEIAKEKTSSGMLYFELPKSINKDIKLEYRPIKIGKEQTKTLAIWNLTVPKLEK